MSDQKLTYQRAWDELVRTKDMLANSGTPDEGVRYLIKGQVRGWVDIGLIADLLAEDVLYDFFERFFFCDDCGGSGEFVINADWPEGDKPYSENCPECGGSGVQDYS